jgi:hypothetical protein
MAIRDQEAGRDYFSTTEAAIGSRLSSRNVMYLCSKGLVPVPEGGTGKGNPRRLAYEGLAYLAVISAFYNAGLEIYLAARLVNEIGDEADFHQLANLGSYLSHPYSGVVSRMREEALDVENAFYLHEGLRRYSNNYQPHHAIEHDRLIEIVDRVFVYLNHLSTEGHSDALAPSRRRTAMYKLQGWKKGTDRLEIEHAPPHRADRLPREWKAAQTNFRGMTCVNVSLAIRDSLDSVVDQRGG